MKTKFLILLILLPILTCSNTFAQIYKQQIINREGFYRTYHKYPDSAVFFAAKLIVDSLGAPYLRDAVHSDPPAMFVSRFRAQARKTSEEASINKGKLFNEPEFDANFDKAIGIMYTTIQKMADNRNSELAAYAGPLYAWLNVQKAKGDHQKITEITKAFIANDLARPDLFENCAARYALLIYMEIEPLKGMETLSDHLLSAIISKLATLQVKGDVNILGDRTLEKRAWYRYVYSWANYYMAQHQLTNSAEAGKYLGMAAQYSPDITDLGRPNDYFIDKKLLADMETRSLANEYLTYLKSGTDKSSTQLALTEMAIRQPDLYKAELKAFYTVNPINKQSFKSYWDMAVSATLSPVPVAGIKMRDGNTFNTSTKTNGKWVLLDFWGTWCLPCRKEHPDLQKLYIDSQKSFSGKLNIITVACHDTEKAVKAYMSEFKYSFPVALSDEKIGKTFNVLGYPTKVLISPQGKYVKVPFGVNWVAFVKAYANID